MNVVTKRVKVDSINFDGDQIANRQYIGKIDFSYLEVTSEEITQWSTMVNSDPYVVSSISGNVHFEGQQYLDFLSQFVSSASGFIWNDTSTTQPYSGDQLQIITEKFTNEKFVTMQEAFSNFRYSYWNTENVPYVLLYSDELDGSTGLIANLQFLSTKSFSPNYDYGFSRVTHIWHFSRFPYASSINSVELFPLSVLKITRLSVGSVYSIFAINKSVARPTYTYFRMWAPVTIGYDNTASAASYSQYYASAEFLETLENFDSVTPGPTPGSHDIADCDIRVDPMSFIYDGQPKTPLVTVYSGLDILSEGTDYVKTYENNIYAGTAAVLVAGIGEYTGSQRVYFTISESGPPATEFRVTLPKYSYNYTGEPVTPPVNVVTTNGTILTENTDYLKTYENNTNIGQASVLVAGINDYADFPSKRVYFNIVEPTPEPPGDTNWYVRLPKYSYDYTGDPITPLVTVTTYTGIGLIEGTDYIKTYQNNTLVGQASVLVVGQGDYSGTQIVYFNIVQPAPDPYSPIGPSGPSDGQGTFNPVSDTLPAYTLPTLNISNTGFTRIYNPTLSQVQALAQYMWTDPSFFQTLFNKLIQVFENPMDAIIAFNIVPCEIPDGGTEEFKVLYLGTGVQMTTAGQQYIPVDCGTVTISEYFGSALDYNPYTKVKCYLPYIGTVELDTDEVMNETLHLVYTIDIVSGACVAQIYINDIPIYQFSGHCAQYIPMAASDFSSYVSALVGISKIVAGVAAAGAGAGADSGAVMNANGLQLTGQTLEKTTQRNPSTGRQITTGTVATEQWSLPPTQASFASQVPGIIANTVGQVVGSKVNVAHTGTFSGSSGFMAYAQPFIRLERPRLVNPAEYSRFNGRPSMITRQLNQLSGYTVVQQVQLTGFTCTQPEMEEISTLLKGGVVF